jgi:hypothetical protein
MLDMADISLLTCVGLVLVGFGSRDLAFIRKEKAKSQKYRLYKVRDDLIYLVAQGKLTEDERLFLLFYGLTNHLIKTTKEFLSLKTFVHAVSSASENPAEEQQLLEISYELKDKDAEVSKVLFEFYHAIIGILFENSFTLRMGYRLKQLWSRAIEHLGPLIPYLSSSHREAYRIWRQYSQAVASLHAT